MPDREPSAASALYPHLRSAERPTQRPSSVSIADAMFPNLAPKPKPPTDPYQAGYLRYMRAIGFISIEGRRR
jgi:hypothetical protein